MDLSSKIQLADGVLCAEKDGKFLFLRPDIPDWVVVNRNAAILLSRCNRPITFEEIVKTLPIDEPLLPQTHALFFEALARGVLVSPAPVTHAQSPALSLDGCAHHKKPNLRTVYLKLTGKCNLRCNYCYAQSGIASDMLSSEDFESYSQQRCFYFQIGRVLFFLAASRYLALMRWTSRDGGENLATSCKS